MRAFIGAVAVLALVGASAGADEKIDAKKLIGKWEPAEAKGAKVVIEFADKGKLTVTIEAAGETQKIEGTYKLDGDKLELAMTFMGEEKKETVTVTKLTDEEMVGKDSKGKEEKFKRLKAK
jgi:uncharacterized protein (TIGR03066 family)